MIRAQGLAARAAFILTVLLAVWLIFTGLGSAGSENIRAAPIEDRGSPRAVKSGAADREGVDALQAMVSAINVATPVGGPEPKLISAVLTKVAANDLALPKPVSLVAEGINPKRPSSSSPLSVEAAPADGDSPEISVVLASVPAAETPVEAHFSDAPPLLREMRSLGSLFTSDPLMPAVRPVEAPSECPAPEVCVDDYLWSLYERTPKIDTNKVVERVRVKVKVTIRKKDKTRTVTKTIIKTNIKYVAGDFTWKDPTAAKRAGMSLKDYVIGGMDPGFKLKLYRALRAMEDAGLMPGLTSAFRDDYRQSIASGNKAASDSSYHGGSRRGGYGRGLAADLVSVKGDTRFQRYASSQELWKWIDAHEKELGIGRPYLDRDPPHVAPLDGAEYATKRVRAIAQTGESQSQKRKRLAEQR